MVVHCPNHDNNYSQVIVDLKYRAVSVSNWYEQHGLFNPYGFCFNVGVFFQNDFKIIIKSLKYHEKYASVC